MTATQTYRFGRYTLRPTAADDLELAAEWTEADPHHRGRVMPDFWLAQNWRSDSYVLNDEAGPVFMARIIIVTAPQDPHPSVEMHIQFPPEPDNAMDRAMLHHRTAQGLYRGLGWLEQMLRKIKVCEIYFESNSDRLTYYATHRLKFRQEGNRLVKHL